MKKIILFLLFFSFLLCGTSNVYASNDVLTQDLVYKQVSLMESYGKMLEEFSDVYGFEDAFGGVYLEKDILVVNLVAGKMSQKIYDYISETYDFKIEYVDYSVNELDSAIDLLSKEMITEDIVMISRDDKNNEIDISIKDLNDEKLNRISETINIRNIEFKSIDYDLSTTAVEVINGNSASIGSISFTVGFAAIRDGKEGFVIPGHISEAGYGVGDNVYYLGRNAGEVKALQFGGTVDAAFVECRTGLFVINHYPSRKFFKGETYFHAAIDPVYLMTGMIVRSYESVSGIQEGEVLSINVTYTVNNIVITNAISADYESYYGDSGSPVTYTHWAGGMNYVRNVMGTQSATLFVNGQWLDGTSFSLFTRVDNIHSVLGLTQY